MKKVPPPQDAYIARHERDGLGRGLHHHGDWPRQTDRHRKQQRGHEREHDRRTADDRADLFGAPLAEIARDQYRDAMASCVTTNVTRLST